MMYNLLGTIKFLFLQICLILHGCVACSSYGKCNFKGNVPTKRKFCTLKSVQLQVNLWKENIQ